MELWSQEWQGDVKMEPLKSENKIQLTYII